MTSLPIAPGLDETVEWPRPSDESKPMPFSRENRMVSFLVLAVLLLTAMGVSGAYGMARWGGSNSTPLVAYVVGTVLLSLKVVIGMLQTEFARRDLKAENKRTRHDMRDALGSATNIMQDLAQKTNGGLTKAVEQVGEEVRKATHDQMVNDPECLRKLEAVAERAAELAAEKAAAKVCEEFRQGRQ